MQLFKTYKGKAIPIFLTFMFMIGIPVLVALIVQYDYIQDLDRVSNERLTLYESTLQSALKKHEYLPFLISETEIVRDLLEGEGNVEEVNSFLESASINSGSAAVYVINENGVVISSSNWKKPKNFIGLNLSFRPYFKDAITGKNGMFFGVGITIGEPGFYISHPIRSNEKIVGVAVAKIVLSSLENLWQEGGETVFVVDANGVIILSSRPSWKYRTLKPLSNETLAKINERGQYPKLKLKHLPAKHTTRMGFMDEVTIDKERFFENTRSIPGMNWDILYLLEQSALWERTLGMSLTTFVLIGLAILTRLLLRERHQKILSRQQAVEAEHIRDINKQLAQEIEDRKRTEVELREAQEELVQAGKLAALGEMATAIAHELNQPIAATKTYIASCKLMLARNLLDELDPTLTKVSKLGDRMAKVTEQLKSFARKSSNTDREFDLRQAINESLTLMKHQMRVEDCELKLTLPDTPILIKGDRVRLEQVLINLFRNALDALQNTESSFIGVTLSASDEKARIRVWDNGPGISSDIDKKLFEPFVTTKKEGVGVGLGLSISYKIIKDMNGDFRARNCLDQGAEFTVYLPLSKQNKES
ncbi:two-component sensor histidine kinase [Pseudodesulfovibrio nedwellii]|uniref:histidine kinase n=1 Tax=Pseudodesulfovibrio nedwellii TaxID=2973072 RepID=A0ABN6RYY6_9BACT|nr:ATP-binding protein [Pseudodesulfovibrio nedwellii]BDQ36204.1 two-component sensor histidine kinase [Pseudodesulfovibrio nedwellii]